MSSSDYLFIFVTDHGGLNSKGDSIIYLWDNGIISASEFNTILKENVNPTSNGRNTRVVHLVLGQCYSGGFIDVMSGSGSFRKPLLVLLMNYHGLLAVLYTMSIYIIGHLQWQERK